jgi:hypothetical protein
MQIVKTKDSESVSLITWGLSAFTNLSKQPQQPTYQKVFFSNFPNFSSHLHHNDRLKGQNVAGQFRCVDNSQFVRVFGRHILQKQNQRELEKASLPNFNFEILTLDIRNYTKNLFYLFVIFDSA